MRTWITVSVVLFVTSIGAAQSKPPVPASAFARWETLAPQPRASSTGPLSPDGKFLVYGVTRQNRDNELRVVTIADGATKTLPLGEQPSFSNNSTWLAYAIGLTEGQEEKLRKDRKPVRRKLGLLNLASGQIATVDEIDTFAFSANGNEIAMRVYPPEPARPQGGDPPPADAEERDKPGSALIVRNLTSGIDTTFGNVTEYAWQTKGPLLAFTVSVEGRRGNGAQVYNAATGVLNVIDSGDAIFSNVAWRKDAADLAVLRSKLDDSRDGPTQLVLAWRSLDASTPLKHVLDPTVAGVLPADRRIVPYRKPEWSRDGQTVFVGLADWFATAGPGKPRDADDVAAVDVWHWKDAAVIPLQKKRIATDRQQNVLAAWHVEANRLVRLAESPLDDVRLIEGQPRALVVDRHVYAMERSIGRHLVDVALVDLGTGVRTPVKERLEDQYVQASPDGQWVLYLLDDHYWIYDLATNTHRNVTKAIATAFVDKQSDATIKQKPAFGVAGWTTGGTSVLLYDKYDVWEIDTRTLAATRLTEGASEQIRHRVVRLDPDERTIDRTRDLYLTMNGEWTKRSGYARLTPTGSRPERMIWQDKRVSRLAKAKDASVFAFTIEGFDDSPDYQIAGPALADARAVTSTNPQHSQYAWGRSEIVEYKNARGERTQGALFYPANYEAGKRYPMVVYMYELLSDTLHNYVSPSERAPYNASVFTSNGYFFFAPDIVFRAREPGVSVVEAVVPGVKAVIQKGAVDAARVGIVGHSWGGFDTVFLATHTDVFAAAVAGAPITNLVSNYGNHHWNQGIAETDHIETGQQRMEVPLWEDLPAYIRNSAVFNAHTMKTPLLVAFGDNDGTVFWHQGVELYNIARRAAKPVVMLSYAGEDHGLRKRANQLDYQQRILQWFGHYLKGEPSQAWIERGVPALERERELKKPMPPKPTTTENPG